MSARPEDIEKLPELLRAINESVVEVDCYPYSISAGMRLDSACEAWLKARGKLEAGNVEQAVRP